MKNLLTILVVFLFFTACKKKDETIYLSQDIKTKFGFKPGSYWIYRDSISGRVDSCYVKGSHLFIADDERIDPDRHEILAFNFVQRPIDTTIHEEIGWDLFFYKGIVKGQTVRTKDTEEDIFATFKCDYPIPKERKEILSEFTGHTYGLTSLSIGGNVFSNVDVIEIERYGHNSFFINDSVGYVKIKMDCAETLWGKNGKWDTIKIKEVWELQRWNVIK